MRIAILCDGVHPYVVGGMQRHTYYLVKYLSRMGVKITLVHFNKSNLDISKLEIFSEEERSNIENIVLQFPKGDGLPGHYVRASYKYSCEAYACIKDRLKEFDFIYTKGFSGWKTIEEKKKNPQDFPKVGVKFHGYEMFQKQANFKSLLQSFILRKPVRWITLNADYVFSYGSKITEIIRGLGVPSSRIAEIPAGIEPDWIRNEVNEVSKVRTFTYLGRYERRKGIEELNNAITQLQKKRTDFIFNFIGPFEPQHKLKFDNLVYHGQITDNQKIREILDRTDFLVCPSWSEGMPNVILEGMARGCAVIATDVGATSIMVGKDNGFLIEAGDTGVIMESIDKAIEMEDVNVLSLKMNSLDKVRDNFVYENILNKFVNKINSIIKND